MARDGPHSDDQPYGRAQAHLAASWVQRYAPELKRRCCRVEPPKALEPLYIAMEDPVRLRGIE